MKNTVTVQVVEQKTSRHAAGDGDQTPIRGQLMQPPPINLHIISIILENSAIVVDNGSRRFDLAENAEKSGKCLNKKIKIRLLYCKCLAVPLYMIY